MITTKEKREALAKRDMETWNGDSTALYDIAMHGCKGYANLSEEVINELYADYGAMAYYSAIEMKTATGRTTYVRYDNDYGDGGQLFCIYPKGTPDTVIFEDFDVSSFETGAGRYFQEPGRIVRKGSRVLYTQRFGIDI